MKVVVNNLVWLALFLIMAAATVYPSVSGVSQAVIWILNVAIIVCAPISIAVSCIEDDKEKLKESAGKEKGFIKKAFGLLKFTLMFSAIAYAGFTVAAVVYAMGAFFVVIARLVARERLKEMA